MKVKATVTGTLDLEKGDVKLLEKASPGEVLDTLRYQAVELKVEIGEPKAQVELRSKIKGLKDKIKGLVGKTEEPKEPETEQTEEQ